MTLLSKNTRRPLLVGIRWQTVVLIHHRMHLTRDRLILLSCLHLLRFFGNFRFPPQAVHIHGATLNLKVRGCNCEFDVLPRLGNHEEQDISG